MYYQILGTNHTSFTVSSLERTLGYLTEVFGFETTSVAERDPTLIQAITAVPQASVLIAYVRGPGHTIELIEYRGPADRAAMKPRPCDVGFAHVAYDVQGIDALCSKLGDYGVHPLAAPIEITNGPNRGKKVVYLRDWDGLTIELIGS